MKNFENNHMRIDFSQISSSRSQHGSEELKLAWAEMSVTDEGVKFTLGNEYAYRSYAIDLERIINRVVSLSEPIQFTINRGRFGRNAGLVTTDRAHNALGRLLLSIFENTHADLLEYYPDHRFSPLVEIALRVAGKYQVTGAKRWEWDTFSERFAQTMTRVVAEIRAEAEKADWKNLKRNFCRNANKNYKNIIKQLKVLLLRHAKVLIIRLDLLYRKISPKCGDEKKISYDTVRADRERFVASLRRTYGEGLLGYVLKLEFGFERGYHYHGIIFLDGSKHREGISNGQRIGGIWRSVAGECGVFNNCNINYKNYKYVGVGMAEYCENSIWEGFKFIAKYLTKTDHHVRLSLPAKHRSLHMSFMPKRMGLSDPRGRPRRKVVPEL